jgi:hypothetical protein
VIPLLLGLLSLLVAPVVDRFVRVGGSAEAWLEGFVLAVVVGAVAGLTLPEALDVAGLTAVVALGVGLGAGVVVHRTLESRGTDVLWLVALLAHSLLDGGTIAADPHAHSLAGAVILHNLPVGLAVWRIATAEGGRRTAVAVLLAMAVATALGFLLLDPLRSRLGASALLVLQCGFAGILLHPLAHLGRSRGPWSAAGVVLGVAALLAVSHVHPPATTPAGGHLGYVATAVALMWRAAPALVVGAAVAAASYRRTLGPWLDPTAVLLSWALVGLGWTLTWVVPAAAVGALQRGSLPPDAPERWVATLARILVGFGLAACLEPTLHLEALPSAAGWLASGLGAALFAAFGPGALPVAAILDHDRPVSLGLLAFAPWFAPSAWAGLRAASWPAIAAAAAVTVAAVTIGALAGLPEGQSLARLHLRAAEGPTPLQLFAAVALGVLTLRSLVRVGPGAVLDSVLHPSPAEAAP